MKKLQKHVSITPESTQAISDTFYEHIAIILRKARATIVQSVDTTMVKAYWQIGKYIVEEEQKGEKRAEYGDKLLKILSKKLSQEFGRGFSLTTLEDIRKFYTAYSVDPESQKPHAVREELVEFSPTLSWIHYRTLMRISRLGARKFYEIEATQNRWSARELERQVNSLLFDRLAKSKDKAGLLNLVHKGQEITKPSDAIKDPFVLEFLDIPEAHQLTESRLEQALIGNLQHFLLELGKGFAFIARQKCQLPLN